MSLFAVVVASAVLSSTYCREEPLPSKQSVSIGKPSKGKLLGAVELEDSDAVRVLPKRHKARCLSWGTERLVKALSRAGSLLQKQVPDSPPLGVGDIARATGGPIPQFSKSHQNGRDADLAFFQLDEKGKPVAADDLIRFGPDLKDESGERTFDTARNWRLVQALLTDKSISIKWIFVSNPLKQALLTEGKRQGASKSLLATAEEVLHQPSDAPPHDDHFHLRISCTAEERAQGCKG